MAKVTLIDDNEDMRALLATLLEIEGFKVKSLRGDEGLIQIKEIIENEKPDLLLLDYNLSTMSGIELLKEIRNTKGLDTVKVLMSSGMPLAEECLHAGANGFLVKPYMPDELINKIKLMIG